jgi:Tol biopolymer transport system component
MIEEIAMKRMTGILVFALLTASCRSEPETPADAGQVLAAGLPISTASASAAEQDSSPMVVRRLWLTPACQFWGDPSPDGRYFTFVDRNTGDVAVHDFRTGEDRRVTSDGSAAGDTPQQAILSNVSPDGQLIAYGWYREGAEELRVIEVNGSEPRVLYRDEAADVNPEEWSEDGSQILVNISRHDGVRQLGLITVDDGSLRVLKTLPEPTTYIWESTLSPDGRFVIYDWPARADAEERDVFILRTDGSGEDVLVDHHADDRVLGWAPDGQHVLFASDRTGTMGAWLLSVEDGRPAGEPELVKPDMWRHVPLGFDAKGSYYYGVDARSSDVHVAALDIETGRLLESPAPVTNRFTGSNRDPAWSSDGRYLAYLSDRSSVAGTVGGVVLVIRSSDSGEKREIQPQLHGPSQLEWSPDGRALLAQAGDGEGRRGIFRIDAQTGEVESLVLWPEDGGVFASWGRNADELVTFRLFAGDAGIEDERSRIGVLDLETGEERVLAERNVYWPAVSRDRRQVVFTREVDGSSGELVVVPVRGGEPRSLLGFDTGGPGWPLNPAWGPEGRYIYYLLRGASEDDPARGLWRVPVAGGEPEQLEWATEEYIKGSGTRNPVVFHPDGRRIALTRRQQGAEIWVMEGFLPGMAGASDKE